MMPLPVKSMIANEVRGDLRAKLDNGNLLLPKRVLAILTSWGVRTAADLLSVLQTFPSGLADELGWEAEDVDHALTVLKAQLKGRVDENVLNPPKREEPVYGAVPPPVIKQKTH